MPDYLAAKDMAKRLRASLARDAIDITHSQSLELVAHQFGLPDWNVLAARIAHAELPALVMPPGWFQSHPNPHYRVGLDPDVPGVVLIEAIEGARPAEITGVIMQSVDAAPYRGRKIALAAELMGRGVGQGAIWARVDPANGKYLRFDNLLDRSHDGALRGTTDWVERSIIVDVPDAAASLHYGALLVGEGELRVRRIRIEPADPDAATTARPPMWPGPTNLDFGASR
jgi:hypothetical protein